MLTKTGNLAGLQNLKQSQLNLGVIQSLAGEVFNTDNCTLFENANGVSFRNPKGLQISSCSITLTPSWVPTGGRWYWILERQAYLWAAPYKSLLGYVAYISDSQVANRSSWLTMYDANYTNALRNAAVACISASSPHTNPIRFEVLAIGLWK